MKDDRSTVEQISAKNNAVKQSGRRGMSVYIFAVLWLIITFGTITAMLKQTASIINEPRNIELMHESEDPNAFTNTDGKKHTPIGNFDILYGSGSDDAAMLPEDAYAPLKALCEIIKSGSPDELGKAFHPEFIETLLDKYSALIALLGGERAAINSIIAVRLAPISADIGAIKKISYNIDAFGEYGNTEIDEMNRTFASNGLAIAADAAYCVTASVTFEGDASSRSEEVRIVLFSEDCVWYIDPYCLGLEF